MRLYLDTSVLGALTDREDPRRMEATRGLLTAIENGTHDAVISNIVQEELEQAPARLRRDIMDEIAEIEFELAIEDTESAALFAEYLAARIVPPRYRNDLRHVAVATVARIDALVSWNFRHLVNLKTRRAVHGVKSASRLSSPRDRLSRGGLSMNRKEEWESPSLRWIHEIRESQYRATRNLPLRAWLKPVDVQETAQACRRLGLKVRLGPRRPRRRVRVGMPKRRGSSRRPSP